MGEIERILRLREEWKNEGDEEKREEIYKDMKELVQEKCERMMRKGLINGASKLIKIAGIKPNLEGSLSVIHSVYIELFEELLMGEIGGKSIEKMKKLYEITGIAPKFTEKDVQRAYEKLVDKEKFSYFDILHELTKIEPHEYLIARVEELREKRERLLKEAFS